MHEAVWVVLWAVVTVLGVKQWRSGALEGGK